MNDTARENPHALLVGALVAASVLAATVGIAVAISRTSTSKKQVISTPAPALPGPSGTPAYGYVKGVPTTIYVSSIGGNKVLRTDAAVAFLRMQEAARQAGITLSPSSAFRSYEEQTYFWNLFQAGQGNKAAQPGYSNHQSGISVDIATDKSYTSPVYVWLSQNASRFGFVNDVSGEPWHWTYTAR